MRGTLGAIAAAALVAALLLTTRAQAITIEDVVKHHPFIVFANSWNLSGQAVQSAPTNLPSEGSPSLPMPAGAPVSPDDMTVEVVPVRLPDLPASVVFALYLLGALVFYTLLVLVAQPSPAEYS